MITDLLRYGGHLPLICVVGNGNYSRSDAYIVIFFKENIGPFDLIFFIFSPKKKCLL